MNIYIFMGTHLPELSTCLSVLRSRLEKPDEATCYFPEGLIPPEDPVNGPLRAYHPETVQWAWNTDDEETAFLVVDPRWSPLSQMEKIAGDLKECLIEPTKVVTCVDMQRTEEIQHVRQWYDACIYYSDVVLLGNRSEVSKAFVSDFQRAYERKCYPCSFLLLKGPGKPDRPDEILRPDTRRLSQLFDLPEADPSLPGLIIEASCDLDLEDAENDPSPGPPEDLAHSQAPIPDITAWIVPQPHS